MNSDDRFEVIGEVTMGLVCFRVKVSFVFFTKSFLLFVSNFSLIFKGENELNETLLKQINEDGKIHMVPSKINDIYFIRFAVCAASSEIVHIDYAWKIIVDTYEKLRTKVPK